MQLHMSYVYFYSCESDGEGNGHSLRLTDRLLESRVGSFWSHGRALISLARVLAQTDKVLSSPQICGDGGVADEAGGGSNARK